MESLRYLVLLGEKLFLGGHLWLLFHQITEKSFTDRISMFQEKVILLCLLYY